MWRVNMSNISSVNIGVGQSSVTGFQGVKDSQPIKQVGSEVVQKSENKQVKSEPSKKQIEQAIEKLNQSVSDKASNLHFSIDQDLKKVIVKVVDNTTGEVVKQIPSKEAVELAKSLEKNSVSQHGLLVDSKV